MADKPVTHPSAILIAGPTASGKTALAVEVARRTNGAVINADSMQVYADLDILSARPDAGERQNIPHLLFGHVDGAVNYSAGLWLADAGRALETVRGEGRVPVIAGGTGLYFKALLEGLSDIPKVPEQVREQVRTAAEGRETPDLHEQLSRDDPIMAHRLKPGDRQRILRALEIFAATGQSLASFQDRRGEPLLRAHDCLCVFLAPDRDVLRARIDARFDAMVERGALDEVRKLAARHLDPALPVMRAHGVPGLLACLAGQMTLEEAVAKGKADTRAYSKRQFTWFRNQLPEFSWHAPEDALDASAGRLGHRGAGDRTS